MRNFIILTVVVVSIGIEGLFGYQYMNTMIPSSSLSIDKILTIKTGIIEKVPKPEDLYTHTLQTEEGLINLNSSSVPLDRYVNTTVTVTGEYSGDTLHVESVN